MSRYAAFSQGWRLSDIVPGEDTCLVSSPRPAGQSNVGAPGRARGSILFPFFLTHLLEVSSPGIQILSIAKDVSIFQSSEASVMFTHPARQARSRM